VCPCRHPERARRIWRRCDEGRAAEVARSRPDGAERRGTRARGERCCSTSPGPSRALGTTVGLAPSRDGQTLRGVQPARSVGPRGDGLGEQAQRRRFAARCGPEPSRPTGNIPRCFRRAPGKTSPDASARADRKHRRTFPRVAPDFESCVYVRLDHYIRRAAESRFVITHVFASRGPSGARTRVIKRVSRWPRARPRSTPCATITSPEWAIHVFTARRRLRVGGACATSHCGTHLCN
jgi:hypothetical protein